MSVRLKVLVITSIAFCALLLVLTTLLRSMLLESYRKIESSDAQQNLDRAFNSLNSSLTNLEQSTMDYSFWDDNYKYMSTRDPSFVEANLTDSSFANNKWNLVALVDAKGEVIYTSLFDLSSKIKAPLTESRLTILKQNLSLLHPDSLQGTRKGILQFPDGPMHIASRNILKSDLSGPPNGIMITGRFLNQSEKSRLSAQTRLALNWKSINREALTATEALAVKSLIKEQDRYFTTLDKKSLLATELLADISGKPSLYLMVTLPRTYYIQGQKSLNDILIAVSLGVFLVFVLIAVLLERLIITRIARLTKEVLSLGLSQDMSKRLSQGGGDEIGILSLSINDLLKSHEQLHQLLEVEQEKSENLLQNVLPASIALRLKQSSGTIAESYAEATILFADIVGFTSMSVTIGPEKMVEWLNEIFSAFDDLAGQFRLEKIKTIGDCYMVVCGLPQKREDHAQAIARMGLAMLEVMQRISQSRNTPIEIRIGICTGPVVAGVIGTKKFLYDLWGDTVNTASRMESHSQPGQIQVTESTYAKLKDEFDFADNGTPDIKGKGPMHTYFLKGEKKLYKAA